MPSFSDPILGKIRNGSKPVPYREALDRVSLNTVKALVMGDMRYVQELLAGLSFFYRKPVAEIEGDLYKVADHELAKLAIRNGITINPRDLH